MSNSLEDALATEIAASMAEAIDRDIVNELINSVNQHTHNTFTGWSVFTIPMTVRVDPVTTLTYTYNFQHEVTSMGYR